MVKKSLKICLHHWLMPISCHFRDCKVLLVTSLTHVSGAIASVQTFTFTFTRFDRQHERDRQTDRHRTTARPRLCIASRGKYREERVHAALTFSLS